MPEVKSLNFFSFLQANDTKFGKKSLNLMSMLVSDWIWIQNMSTSDLNARLEMNNLFQKKPKLICKECTIPIVCLSIMHRQAQISDQPQVQSRTNSSRSAQVRICFLFVHSCILHCSSYFTLQVTYKDVTSLDSIKKIYAVIQEGQVHSCRTGLFL